MANRKDIEAHIEQKADKMASLIREFEGRNGQAEHSVISRYSKWIGTSAG